MVEKKVQQIGSPVCSKCAADHRLNGRFKRIQMRLAGIGSLAMGTKFGRRINRCELYSGARFHWVEELMNAWRIWGGEDDQLESDLLAVVQRMFLFELDPKLLNPNHNPPRLMR